MSTKLLLANFDGTMPYLEVRPACRDTYVLLHTQYWNREDRLVSGKLEFFGVASVGFSVNYLDTPIGSELCGLYELEDEEEKLRLLRENFDRRRRDFLLTGYDLQEDDPGEFLNDYGRLEQICPADYHLYEQQTLGGVYRILAQGWKLEE